MRGSSKILGLKYSVQLRQTKVLNGDAASDGAGDSDETPDGDDSGCAGEAGGDRDGAGGDAGDSDDTGVVTKVMPVVAMMVTPVRAPGV